MPIYLIIFFSIHFVLALVVITMLLKNKKLEAGQVRKYIQIALFVPIAGSVVGFAFCNGILASSLVDKGGISGGSNGSDSGCGDGGGD